MNVESPDAFIVRQLLVHHFQSLFHLSIADVTGEDRAQKRAPVADHNGLLSASLPQQQILNRLGSDVVARVEHDQVLDASCDSPIAGGIAISLIAGMEPPAAHYVAGGLGTIPVSKKQIRAPHENLVSISYGHLNALARGTDAARHDIPRIVHGGDRRGLRQAV